MKSSLFVIFALFASTSAIKTMQEEDYINLQIGVEATARANVREMLKTNLRAALEPATQEVTAVQLDEQRGDAWPGPICPGSEPLLPIASSNPMVFEEASFVQLQDDDLPSVEDAKIQAAQMQAQMDQAVADADARRAQQQAQYESNIKNDDPAWSTSRFDECSGISSQTQLRLQCQAK